MWDWIGKLSALRAEGRAAAVVTVIAVAGSTPREAGAKMVVTKEAFFGTIGGGHLEQVAIADARSCLDEGATRCFRYPLGAKLGQCCGGLMEVLVETVNTGPRLYLFGAGHVGGAICRVLEGTPFSVDLVDERAEWLDAVGLPASVRRHALPWDEFVETAEWEPTRTYAAVMTFQHDLDQTIIADLVRRPARFLGLIGSRSKWNRFRMRLSQRGYTDEELGRVHCPIGLELGGGKAPQEVAISVAAQLLSVHHASEERNVPGKKEGPEG